MTKRLTSIDALRGLVMVIMALDHVRDFIHRGAMSFSPTDLGRTTPFLFFTRWITHFCAPVFMFTAGMGAFLWWQRGRTRAELSRFLLTRGLWLIFLEVSVMRLAYEFNFALRDPLLLVVLWVLGACMMVLAALVWLPLPVLAVLSAAAIALHNALDGIRSTAAWWRLLHVPGPIPIGGSAAIVAYPLVPWFAVMAGGFCLGRVFLIDAEGRGRILLISGAGATLAFFAIRAVNGYGDPFKWSAARFPALSFLNTTKYPPSLDFLLMTLGPALIVLALFERIEFGPSNPLVIFGRVPLFYFVVHFYAAHAAAALLAWIRYGGAAAGFIFNPVPSMGGAHFPAGFGYDLWVAYAVWAAIVAGLYPLCRWYAGVKAARRSWWLSYL